MELCVFSKHFQEMGPEQLAATMRDLGVEGVDLTVRPGGHVEPARVEQDLPAFQQALANGGVGISMLTTAITGADEPDASTVIEAAARAGVPYVKLGYWQYRGFGHYAEQADEVRAALSGLEPLLRANGVKAGFHTHSGHFMGPNAEFVLRLIEHCDPEVLGVYYDAGHCTVEGGGAGWMMGLDAVADRLFMVAVKDMAFFRMGSASGGRKGWTLKMVPLEAGLVDWPELVRCLKAVDFHGPVSIHSEYQGAHSFEDMTTERLIEQTRRDLDYFRSLL
jgi:sugar phosphate isomerase/epimerase